MAEGTSIREKMRSMARASLLAAKRTARADTDTATSAASTSSTESPPPLVPTAALAGRKTLAQPNFPIRSSTDVAAIFPPVALATSDSSQVGRLLPLPGGQSAPLPVESPVSSSSDCDLPRKDCLTLLACFEALFRTLSQRSKLVYVLVFDKICYFSSTPHIPLSDLSRLVPNSQFEAYYSRQSQKRNTYDRVTINLMGSWQDLPKPGNASEAIDYVDTEQPFVSQTTALQRVNNFCLHTHGFPWLLKASPALWSRSGALQLSALANDDIQLLLAHVDPAQSEPPVAEDARVGSPDEISVVGVRTSSGFRSAASGAAAEGAPLGHYKELPAHCASACTSCPSCGRRFRFASENILHFVVDTGCREKLVRATSPHQSFMKNIYDQVAKRCGVTTPGFACSQCSGQVFDGPMQYCIHRDYHLNSHKPDYLFLCQFCSKLFLSPGTFYRHPCVRNWNITLTRAAILERLERGLLSLEVPETAFTVYGRFKAGEDDILKCPACSKKFPYMSGSLSHLMSNPGCLKELRRRLKSPSLRTKTPEDGLDVTRALLLTTGVRSLVCEDCGETLSTQVGYAVHRDHHLIKSKGILICKGCNNEFKRPCEFYRHLCGLGSSAERTLNWCPFCHVYDLVIDEAERQLLKESVQSYMAQQQTNSDETRIRIVDVTSLSTPKDDDEVLILGEAAPADHNNRPLNPFAKRQRLDPAVEAVSSSQEPSSTCNALLPGQVVPRPVVVTSASPFISANQAMVRAAHGVKGPGFVCLDCNPHRILDSQSAAAHSKTHVNIRPLSDYRMRVVLTDIADVKGNNALK